MAPTPTGRDLERLAGKYRVLGELRRARARGEPIPPREVFAALAEEFPGALNELDTLALTAIDERSEALLAAAAGAATEAWMEWLYGYHGLLRAALYIKVRVPRDRELSDELARKLTEDGARRAGLSADALGEGFARGVARPPGGRLNTLVYRRLAEVFGVPPRELQRALFPGLRLRAT